MSDVHSATAPDEFGLSAAELDYLSSRGEKTDGLVPDAAPAGGVVADPPKVADPAKAAVEPAKVAGAPAADPAADKKDPAIAGADADDEERVEVPNRGQFVRHGAFHKERETRKKLQLDLAERDKRIADLTERFARGDERLRLLSEAMTPPAAAAVDPVKAAEAELGPMPKPEEDPLGAIAWQAKKIELIEGRVGGVAGEVGKVQEQTAAERQESELKTAYATDARSYIAKVPDFGAAYSYLLTLRDKQLEVIGVTDPQERAKILVEEERDLARGALKAKRSPSDQLYKLAESMGYKKAEPAPAPAAAVDPAAAPVAAAAPAPAAAAPAAIPTATEELARIRAGKEASLSLSNGGGSPPPSLTMESLLALSDDDFKVMLRKNPSAVNQLLGKTAH